MAHMTDREVYVHTLGFLRYLGKTDGLKPGEPVAVAEDLRAVDPSTGLSSSPRIGHAVCRAIRDAGHRPAHCGRVPTPALAHWAINKAGPVPCIMVTGSHIPADRNGVKFYRRRGEVLKEDEARILDDVATIRERPREFEKLFDEAGMFREAPRSEPVEAGAENAYVERYLGLFPGERPLAGKRVVLFQHSAVGRDLVLRILEGLGALVVPVERSASFVAMDTEDVSPEHEATFRNWARTHRPDAIVSTDGDGDRPLVVDETGRFHRGDVLGLITAEFLGARFGAVPVSVSDALDRRIAERARSGGVRLALVKTRIGSPYVIEAMDRAVAEGRAGVVGWEANGGFLTGTDFDLNGRWLAALPTRDAVLPLLAALLTAARDRCQLSEVFCRLPQRATRSGLVDDFSPERSRAVLTRFQTMGPNVIEVLFDDGAVRVRREPDSPATTAGDAEVAGARVCRALVERYWTANLGFGPVTRINLLDGVRVVFANGDVVHLRPSGNAPQFRVYATSDTQKRADEIVTQVVRDPDGILLALERDRPH